jgi:hypothetical protein
MLLQMGLQELFSFKTLTAENALKRFLLLMHLYHMFPEFLLIDKDFIAIFATILDLRIPLMILPVFQKL